ncbi:MAG: hypothetical protein V8Q83_10435 [Blautia sp.]
MIDRKKKRQGFMMEWNRPRSVRQIGSVPGRERIYVEDYVMRFAKRLAAKQSDNEKAAMLLGNQYHYNGQKIVQISGIVEIPQFARRNSPVLSPQSWDSVYTEIKENFTDLDIVGWFYTARDFDRQDAGKLLEIHKANFQHRDKVLYILDEKEQEDGMFLYHMGNFERQQGYYIYYEKNPEMLYYMEKESKRHVHLVEQEDDRVIRNIRGIMEEKEKVKQQKNREKKNRPRPWGCGGTGNPSAGSVYFAESDYVDPVKKSTGRSERGCYTKPAGGQDGGGNP